MVEADQAALVVLEVAEAHEGCRVLVLRNVGADAAWVAASTGVEQTAELVVCNLVAVATGLAQVLLHVEGHLELKLDDVDDHLLRNEAFLGRLAAKCNKNLQVLVEVSLLLGQ